MAFDPVDLAREEQLRQKRKRIIKKLKKKKRKLASQRLSLRSRNKSDRKGPICNLCDELSSSAKGFFEERSFQTILRFIALLVFLALLQSSISKYITSRRTETLDVAAPIDNHVLQTASAPKARDQFMGWRKVVRKKEDGTYEEYFFNRVSGKRSETVPIEMIDGEIRGDWQRFFDKETQRFFYRNVDTGAVTWLAPKYFDEDNVLLNVMIKKTRLRGGQLTIDSVGKKDDQSRTEDFDPSNVSLSGWRRVPTPKTYLEKHPLSAKFYFVHELTKNSTWNPPAAWKKMYQKKTDIFKTVNDTYKVTEKTTLDGWQRHFDKTRREYFYSSVLTGETTWTQPNKKWRKILLHEQFCAPPRIDVTQNEGPILKNHDKYILMEKFEIKEGSLTEGNSETPEECCRFCELEKLCLGFVHIGRTCYLKQEGGEVEPLARNVKTPLTTLGIRIKPKSVAANLDQDGKLREKVESGTFVLY